MQHLQRTRPHAAGLALILAAGVALRWMYLGRASLWWDEIVHIWTSQSGGLGDVLGEVKRGIPPGMGNAGAVPLDYALLFFYLRLVPRPSPAFLEIYYRLPSFLYSSAALVLLYALARRAFDRGVALLASLLLALSLPHILYAAEARFYSLFVLLTIANLLAFTRVLEKRGALGSWTIFSATNVLYFFSGLFSLWILLWQYAILGVLVLSARDLSARERRRELALLGGSSAIVLGCVAAYFSGTSLTATYTRTAALDPLGLTLETLFYFSSRSYLLLGCLLALPLAWLYAGRRGGVAGPLVLALQASLTSIALIVLLARWKHYYFHPRHALFLLPSVSLLTAIGLLALLRVLDPLRRLFPSSARREAGNLALAVLLVVALEAPALWGFAHDPDRIFTQSKSMYDWKRLAQHLEQHVAGYAPGEKYLLVAQRSSVPNAALSQYLKWYGLADRVVLRGTNDPLATLAKLDAMCANGCPLERGPAVDIALGLVAPVGLTPDFRRLLDLLKPVGFWPGRVRDIGVVVYAPRVPPTPHLTRQRHIGFQLLETRSPPERKRPSPG